MLTKNTAVLLVALAASLLLLAMPSMAAPARQVRQAEPDLNDIRSRMLSGLRASDCYVANPSNQQAQLLTTTDSDIGIIFDHLCDLLAYYELANKINSAGDLNLQAILKENVIDACTWVKYLNVTHSAVQANADPLASSSCSAEEITYLHLQCLNRKVKSVTSNAQSSTELLYLGVPTYPIMWVDATSMSATRKTAVKNSLGSCN